MEIYLGIDTSCYTTSLAAVDGEGKLVADLRQLLRVEPGERGLQQSAALFQHVQNLPPLINRLAEEIDFSLVQAVASSARPRPVEGSYMPVFTVAAGQGQILSRALNVPWLETSHQEGHLMAGIWSAEGPVGESFLAVHLSGGTSELLRVSRNSLSSQGPVFRIELLGGSTDLHAGQFVDRVGVRLGLPFPAGPHLEALAQKGEGGKGLIPSAVKGYEVSFSGPESQAQRLIDKGVPPEQVARGVESCIARTLEKLIRRGAEEHNLKEVLIVGGVAANRFLRLELQERLQGVKFFFAQPVFSSDNGVGTALIGLAKQRPQVPLCNWKLV